MCIRDRGAAGAVWYGPTRPVSAPAQLVPVVDPTGAGDAFAAGLLASWVTAHAGPEPAAALSAAATAGALAVGLVGARPPVPVRDPRQ